MGTDSPVSIEFALAALQMQSVSGGRFEAGLGAGWSRDEAVGAGLGYPSTGVRAGRYIEAVLGDSFLGGFFGEPAKVANSMMALADAGIDRVQVSTPDDASFALLSS